MGDPHNPDPAIIGRRASDGEYLSLREALNTFATKEEIAGMHTSISLIMAQVNALPPRAELQVRWERDEESKKRLETGIDKLQAGVEELKADRLPRWTIPALAILITAIFGGVQILMRYWTPGVPH